MLDRNATRTGQRGMGALVRIMPWYLTEYKPDGVQSYGTSLWAKNKKDAETVAKLRGMGEVLISKGATKGRPFPRCSTILRARKQSVKEKVHALCFLSTLAWSSGKADYRDLIGDLGIIHEYAHGVPMKRIMPAVLELEKLVPGYLTGEERRKMK